VAYLTHTWVGALAVRRHIRRLGAATEATQICVDDLQPSYRPRITHPQSSVVTYTSVVLVVKGSEFLSGHG
jgi:hypothetical protein